MLKVVMARPPPVPQVSTSASVSDAGTRIIAPRIARTPPATSAGVSPFARSPMSRATF